MSENNERRFYRGSARWVIIGIIAAFAVIFVIVVAFGSTLFPSGPRTGGMQSETGEQSATSGPGHNTTETTTGGAEPLESQEDAIAGNTTTNPGVEQIPDAGVTFGRETTTQNTSIPGQQGGLSNNTINGTVGGGLENPLSENITSLTGTAS